MRQNLPSSINRLCRVPRRRFQPIARHGVRFIVTSPPHRLAQVRSDCDGLPELWFSSTPPYQCIGNEQAAKNEAKANERTLKLGKSKSLNCHICLDNADITHLSSSPSSSATSTHSPRFASSPRDTLTANQAPPLPLHPPTSPHRLRPRCLPRGIMVRTRCLGSSPYCRKCQAHHHLGANGEMRSFYPQRGPLHRHIFSGKTERTPHRPLANLLPLRHHQ